MLVGREKEEALKKDHEGRVRVGKREKGSACGSKREKHFKGEVEGH